MANSLLVIYKTTALQADVVNFKALYHFVVSVKKKRDNS